MASPWCLAAGFAVVDLAAAGILAASLTVASALAAGYFGTGLAAAAETLTATGFLPTGFALTVAVSVAVLVVVSAMIFSFRGGNFNIKTYSGWRPVNGVPRQSLTQRSYCSTRIKAEE